MTLLESTLLAGLLSALGIGVGKLWGFADKVSRRDCDQRHTEMKDAIGEKIDHLAEKMDLMVRNLSRDTDRK